MVRVTITAIGTNSLFGVLAESLRIEAHSATPLEALGA
jgi:hypothetical protein